MSFNSENRPNEFRQWFQIVCKYVIIADKYYKGTAQHIKNQSDFLPLAICHSVLPFRKKIIPDLGPRSVLWTVVVTTSQKGNGDGTTPAATRPAMWAMSAIWKLRFKQALDKNLQ